MVRSHCLTLTQTPRPIKNGLYRIVWRCSYCTETDIITDSIGHCTDFIGLGLSVFVGVGQCEHTITTSFLRLRDTNFFYIRRILFM